MTILQVLYVLEIAKYGSISKEAESLYVSQPALSLQVKQLESELNCELFYRHPQGVSLTNAGKVFCEDAQAVANAWNRLQESASFLDNSGRREFRVGIGPRALASGFFEYIAAFFDKHPEIEVTYRTDMGDQVIEALEERRIDLAIDRLPPDKVCTKLDHIAFFELLQERQCILLSPNDSRAGCKELALSALDGSTLITAPESTLDNIVMEAHGVHITNIQRADNLEMAMTLIQSGKGFALGAPSFAKRYHVAAVPALPPAYVSLNMMCLKRTAQDSLIQKLKNSLMKVTTEYKIGDT